MKALAWILRIIGLFWLVVIIGGLAGRLEAAYRLFGVAGALSHVDWIAVVIKVAIGLFLIWIASRMDSRQLAQKAGKPHSDSVS